MAATQQDEKRAAEKVIRITRELCAALVSHREILPGSLNQQLNAVLDAIEEYEFTL